MLAHLSNESLKSYTRHLYPLALVFNWNGLLDSSLNFIFSPPTGIYDLCFSRFSNRACFVLFREGEWVWIFQAEVVGLPWEFWGRSRHRVCNAPGGWQVFVLFSPETMAALDLLQPKQRRVSLPSPLSKATRKGLILEKGLPSNSFLQSHHHTHPPPPLLFP
jgi:hypothetical protein